MGSDRIAKTRKVAKEQIAHPPAPPGHLSKKMKEFWRTVFYINNPQPHEVLLLVKACEAHDRAEQARRVLKKEGLVYLDRFEKPKARPEVGIELTSKTFSSEF